MFDGVVEWAKRVAAGGPVQDYVALSFVAGVALLVTLLPFSRHLRKVFTRPATGHVVIAAFLLLGFLTLLALIFGR